MQSRLIVDQCCPVAGRKVRVEEIYLVEGTSTCQVEWQLIHRRCLNEPGCPGRAACPLDLDSTD